MNELIDFVLVSVVLVSIGIYGLVVKRNAVRMIFSIEIIANAANLKALDRRIDNSFVSLLPKCTHRFNGKKSSDLGADR